MGRFYASRFVCPPPSNSLQDAASALIEDRLYDETWALSEYDLLPRLIQLRIPTLIVHGEYDLVPQECAAHIAQAMPAARLVLLHDCGHFSYMECPEAVRNALADFFHGT